MKVVLKDKRNNPRIIYIDGKRYVLPSNKEVIKEISRNAYNYLSQCSWIEVRKYVEVKTSESEPTKELDVNIIENNITTNVVEVVDDVVETVDPVVETVNEEVSTEDILSDENVEPVLVNSENVKAEEIELENNNSDKEKDTESVINYAAMSKKELRAVIEEMGGDSSGMSKANMLDWLKNK